MKKKRRESHVAVWGMEPSRQWEERGEREGVREIRMGGQGRS